MRVYVQLDLEGVAGFVQRDNRDTDESGMFVAQTGSRGIPVVLISGDRAAVEEVRPPTPGSELVVTKVALGPTLAKSLTPAATERLLRDAAEKGIRRMDVIEPYRISPPFTFSWKGRGTRKEHTGDDPSES